MITITLDKRDVDSLMEKLKRLSIRDRSKAMKSAFRDATLATEKQLKQNVSGRFLNVRTGRLRSSESSVIIEHKDDLLGVIGSGVRQGKRVVYDRIQEEGGTIRPKRKKYLTIPLKAALTASGAMKYPSAREYPNTFIANDIIWQKLATKKIVPLFKLAKQAVIPAHRYMSRTVREMQPKIMDIMLKAVQRIIDRKS